MTTHPAPIAEPVTGRLQREAVARLLGGGKAPPEAVDRFITDAPALGVDLDLLAAVVRRSPGQAPAVRQSCLAVLGAGRTVMLFVSGPGPTETFGSAAVQNGERAAAITAALHHARERAGDGVRLVQGLAEPRESWLSQAYETAGLRRIAELLYLSRPLKLGDGLGVIREDGSVEGPGGWPDGVSVRRLRPGAADDRVLAGVLERTYAQTLDCPELAGLREPADIVASHRSVGEYDPSLWWLVESQGAPEGCVLLNRCHAQRCVELVYVGLSPALRGSGLGRSLLGAAIRASALLERELRCAVDSRNAPARRMYERAEFKTVGSRLAYVALVADIVERNPACR